MGPHISLTGHKYSLHYWVVCRHFILYKNLRRRQKSHPPNCISRNFICATLSKLFPDNNLGNSWDSSCFSFLKDHRLTQYFVQCLKTIFHIFLSAFKLFLHKERVNPDHYSIMDRKSIVVFLLSFLETYFFWQIIR